MTLFNPEVTALLYLVAAVCFILALKGLSSPKSARRGNLIGAAGALVGMVTVFLSSRIENLPWILGTIAVGSAIAVPISRRVKMTQMPQLVALFNGVGGGAVALIAWSEFRTSGGFLDTATYVVVAIFFSAVTLVAALWAARRAATADPVTALRAD